MFKFHYILYIISDIKYIYIYIYIYIILFIKYLLILHHNIGLNHIQIFRYEILIKDYVILAKMLKVINLKR